jgi:zinc protease
LALKPTNSSQTTEHKKRKRACRCHRHGRSAGFFCNCGTIPADYQHLCNAADIKASEHGITGASSLDNFEALLQLVYLYFTAPGIEKDAFDMLAAMNEKELAKWNKGASSLEDTVRYLLGKNNVAFNKEALANVRLDRALKIYKERFANAGAFTCVIAGYFETEKIKDQIARYLGALPGFQLKKEIKQRISYTHKSNEDARVTMVGDSTGNVNIKMLFSGSYEPSEINTLKLEILNESVRTLLFRRLREKEKGVYDVQMTLQTLTKEGRYSFDIDFETSPGNVDRLVAAAVSEISNLSEAGIDSDVFNNSLAVVRRKVLREMKDPGYWTGHLAEQLRKGKISSDILNRENILNNLTTSDIQEAAGKFLDTEHYMLFKLL